MTVLTMPAQPGQNTAPRPLPWRRMAWVTWRQHRATLISVPAVLGAVAILLVIFGLKVHRDYAALVNCPLVGSVQNESGTCQHLFQNFNSTDWPLGNTCAILMALVPVLIGAFAGAPLLARELETGTYRYAWTQGFGRERQAIAKLALVGVMLAVLAGAFGELFAWFFQPFLYTEQMNALTERCSTPAGWCSPPSRWPRSRSARSSACSSAASSPRWPPPWAFISCSASSPGACASTTRWRWSRATPRSSASSRRPACPAFPGS